MVMSERLLHGCKHMTYCPKFDIDFRLFESEVSLDIVVQFLHLRGGEALQEI